MIRNVSTLRTAPPNFLARLSDGVDPVIFISPMEAEPNVFSEFDSWTTQFASFVTAKGKVTPGTYRAYAYEAPGHLWKDVKLVWRELQMSMGKAPKDSSPAKQEKLGLNRDATFSWKKSEGKKLRE